MGRGLIKALIIGVGCWLIIALIATVRFDMTFVQALIRPYTIFLAVIAAIGSYVGFRRNSR